MFTKRVCVRNRSSLKTKFRAISFSQSHKPLPISCAHLSSLGNLTIVAEFVQFTSGLLDILFLLALCLWGTPYLHNIPDADSLTQRRFSIQGMGEMTLGLRSLNCCLVMVLGTYCAVPGYADTSNQSQMRNRYQEPTCASNERAREALYSLAAQDKF